jgi:hypothetical protein
MPLGYKEYPFVQEFTEAERAEIDVMNGMFGIILETYRAKKSQGFIKSLGKTATKKAYYEDDSLPKDQEVAAWIQEGDSIQKPQLWTQKVQKNTHEPVADPDLRAISNNFRGEISYPDYGRSGDMPLSEEHRLEIANDIISTLALIREANQTTAAAA